MRRGLSVLRGKARLDLLLDQPDPAAVVRALPADELYHAIQDAGLADAAAVVQLASPDQFRAFLDLDAWRGEELEPHRVLPWIHAARGSIHRDEDTDAWREKLEGLDPEVVSLLLRSTLRIHDLEEDPDPEIEGDRVVRTPDGHYVVEFEPQGAEHATLRRLLDDLYDRDPFLAGRILSAVRWELDGDLAEAALRWRNGRLADLGFPTFEEALSWFARTASGPGTTRHAEPAGLPDRPPGFWLASFRADALLDRAAAGLSAEERERLELGVLGAVNAVLVADRVDPSDPDAVAGAVGTARTFLELGLEALSGGDVAAATAVLAATPVKAVFQRGFADVLALRWRAERARRAAAESGPVPALDSPIGEAFAAVQHRRPRYFPGLERPRDEWGSVATSAFQERPFRSAGDLRRTAAALGDAEGLLALGRTLGLVPPATGAPPGPPPATLATLYLTALANERLGRPFAPVPLGREELPAAARALSSLDDPRLASAGEPGALLATLAANRAAELAPVRAGEEPPPGAIAAVLVA